MLGFVWTRSVSLSGVEKVLSSLRYRNHLGGFPPFLK
nr:MAG TPA: hypothetical protein [Caudoviricetes sp.]